MERVNSDNNNNNNNLHVRNIIVRINGVLPDFSTLGSHDKSERAAEARLKGISSNTSCSIFALNETNHIVFHLLVDVGQGIVKSIEKGVQSLGFKTTTSSSFQYIPDVVLITHSHDDHIKELPILIDRANINLKNLQIFCTSACYDQITKKLPEVSSLSSSSFKLNSNNYVSFNMINPGESIEIGPFSVRPLLAYHGTDSPPGCVCYVVRILDNKIIIGWDFLSLPDTSENLLWNPDLLILGTENYNSHPDTGMVSVIEAFDIVRRWNAKECYIVHYSGLTDFREAKNQWFRGPIKAMTTEELQNTIDSHLRLTSDGGKFKITVATDGMVWRPKNENYQKKQQHSERILDDDNFQVGKVLSIESLQKYVLLIERDTEKDKLMLMIEDRVNRYNLVFDKPYKDNNNENIVYAQGEKGMMARGPQLTMEIIDADPSHDNSTTIRINVSKGKKMVFKDNIIIDDIDAIRLRKYIKENFK
ncbi:MAG TPA: MBL fold metallo-hydrolase [Nitrososphaeraceae archaeon]|nr:MBL fold metallo-hydrolase [Nitrososphaeraceae archaeon]